MSYRLWRATRLWFAAALVFFFSFSFAIHAQETQTEETETGTEESEPESEEESRPWVPGERDQAGNGYDHRFRLLMGFGAATITPPVLSEANDSWFLNSIIANSQNSDTSVVLPLSEPGNLDALSYNLGFEYNYIDRLTVSLSHYAMDQTYGREANATADFFHPAGGTKRWSYFEGVRLVRYYQEQRTLDAEYVHPVWIRGFKAGLSVGREWYRERDEISYGSYVATTNADAIAPGTLNWSQGSIVPTSIAMSGWVYGPALRYQLFDWLGFRYRFMLFERAGTLSFTGIRSIQQFDENAETTIVSLLAPYALGRMTDSGTRHNLETELTFLCRYSFILGFMLEDYTRTYSEYFGGTFAASSIPFQQKTPNFFGYGELSGAHPGARWEIYLKFAAAVFH